MGTVPERSIPSMASQMQSMKIKDKAEKSAMIRIGVLIDSIVNSQRGLANAGARQNRRSAATNAKRPALVFGETENVFNGASVTIDPIRSAAGLSNYEIQIDNDPRFSDPTTKVAFNKNIIFKGLLPGTTYYIRVRALTKGGQVGPWSSLDPVITTVRQGASTADFDGTLVDNDGPSKTLTFNYASESLFAASNLGLTNFSEGGGGPELGPVHWAGIDVLGILSSPTLPFGFQTIDQEKLETIPLTTDTSGVTYNFTLGQMLRYWPILMYILYNPTTDPEVLEYTQQSASPFDFTLPLNMVFASTGSPSVFIKF